MINYMSSLVSRGTNVVYWMIDPAKIRPLPNLSNDIWKVIFSEMNYKGLQTCSVVNKEWKKLTSDLMVSKLVIYNDFCFNPTHWNLFYGEGCVSNDEIKIAFDKLPENIDEILKSPFPKFFGKKVVDTHVLVWIPETINKQSVHINSLEQLLKKRPESYNNRVGYHAIWDTIVQQIGNKSIESGWILMTTDILPGSKGKTFAYQQSMITDLDGYSVPKTAEAIACVAAEFIRSGRCLFNNKSLNYTRCQESILGRQVWLGDFGVETLVYESFHIGVACLRRL